MNIISRTEAKQLGLKRYFTGKPCKHGHIDERRVSNGECFTCMRNYNNRRYANDPDKMKQAAKIYRDNNKDLVNEKYRQWVAENPDKAKQSQVNYKKNNKSKIQAREKAYRESNKERRAELNRNWSGKNRDRINRNRRNRLKTNLNAKLTKQCRDMLTRVVNASKVGKSGSTFDILGYTVDDLKSHIESQFVDGMTWENHGEWHIDHIIPISMWIKAGVTNPDVINALDNLQPLWADDNLRKGDRAL